VKTGSNEYKMGGRQMENKNNASDSNHKGITCFVFDLIAQVCSELHMNHENSTEPV
jgi:hypothetical protein